MPKINRIRIANVSYGGKNILDQVINSYEGENILINLANGGGKSVLTQMFLQPILPLQKVHKRSVDSYLSTQGPTFAMIEWKLDNKLKDTYFLTGIVIHKVYVVDNNERIKYFTFVNEYQSANLFDLNNIDFIINEDGFVKYKSYDYCLKSLREQEKENSKVNVYSSDERKEYNEILEEHGIFKDEWKILAKINEKEGGIDDLFEKCETSDDVINNWILKNISNNLSNSDKLNEMFSNLIEDIIQKEDVISRKEVLDDFNSIAKEYIEKVKILLNSISEETDILKELEENYLKLQTFSTGKENELKKVKEDNLKIMDDLNNIDYEEISEEIHRLEFNLEQKNNEIDKVSNDKEKYENTTKDVKKNIDVLNASKIFKNLRLENDKLILANRRKMELENEKATDERKSIEYSLKKKYEEKLEKLSNTISDLENELNDIEKLVNSNKEKERYIEEKIIENSANIGSLDTNIINFKELEFNIKQKLNLNFSRNILGELDINEINKIFENYENISKIYSETNEKLKNKIELESKKQIQCKEEKKSLEGDIEVEAKLLENAKRDLEEYKSKETEVARALESISIDRERLFDKEENLIEIKRRLENVDKRSTENILTLNKIKEEKIKLEDGEYHIDFEFGKILDDNKIKYETGESYLSSQSREYIEKLLNINPMLPYSYIIFDEKDYKKILSLKFTLYSTKIIPIILLKDIEKLGYSENRFINVNNLFLACFYNEKVFNPELKVKFLESLSNEIENLEELCKSDKIEIKKINDVISKIKIFNYEKDSKKKMEETISNLIENLENKKKSKDILDVEIEKSHKNIEELKNEIVENDKLIDDNIKESEEFEKFISKNKVYCDNVKEKDKLEKENINLSQEKENITIKNNELEKNRYNKRIEKNNLENQKQKINDKYSMVEFSEETILLEFPLEVLEEMYNELKANFSVSENEILKNIEDATKRIEEYERDLNKKYSNLKEEYENVEYSEEKLDLYEEEYENITEKLEKIKTQLSQINGDKIRVETNLQNRRQDLVKLKKEGPLEPKEIKGRYEERRKELKEKSQENEIIEQNIILCINKIKNEINKIARNVDIEECYRKNSERKPDITSFDINNLNTDVLSRKLKDKKDSNTRAINELKNIYNDIYNANKGKDQAIDNILKNMNSNSGKDIYDDYYFIYERTLNSLKILNDMINAINADIMHIEDDKTNFKRHAFMQGKNIYLEMKSISDSSTIKMIGKSRKVPLMEIVLPKELDLSAEERVNEYIEKCILDLREECKVNENPKLIIEKKVKILLSDRELLNKVINSESIDLKLYKIDINDESSGLKRWKDVIIENSGGEKLISCLILVLALMQYTRRKILEKYGESENREMSKIFIIDNPFGKMSSTHLLNGLMMILDKFNVQVICLSDISQSSITNQFNLIYQMSLKTALYANNSYLTVDRIINDNNLKNNSALENVFIKAESQVKMW